MTGLIQAIRFDKGKTHDFDLYKNSNFNLSDELEINVDSGFQGIQKLHKKVNLPQKSSNTGTRFVRYFSTTQNSVHGQQILLTFISVRPENVRADALSLANKHAWPYHRALLVRPF